MDFQTRKLNLIEYLFGLQDESLFEKIESVIINNKKKSTEKHFVPFTEQELIDRANRSSNDYSENRVKTQGQLEKESEN